MKFKSCLKVGAATFELACGRHAASTQQNYTVCGANVRIAVRKMAMFRRVLISVCAAVLCLSVAAQSLYARPVKHGTMDICATVDHGTVSTVDGVEVCCAHATNSDSGPPGPYYCVQCDPAGSNNCETWTASKAPSDRLVSIIQAGILVERERAEQRRIRKDLVRALIEVDNLQNRINAGMCAPPVK
jgi:hypothetical protein